MSAKQIKSFELCLCFLFLSLSLTLHFDPLDIVKITNQQKKKQDLDEIIKKKPYYTHTNKPTHNLVMSKSCDLWKKKIDYTLLWPIILNNIEITIIHMSLSHSFSPYELCQTELKNKNEIFMP